MKKFQQYINEKLKLDDISKIAKNHWIDASKLTLDDFKEGNIIQTGDNCLYIVVPKKLFPRSVTLPRYINDEFIFATLDYSIGSVDYMSFESYKNHYPFTDTHNYKFKILRIYNRKKSYKNPQEVYDDLVRVCLNKNYK